MRLLLPALLLTAGLAPHAQAETVTRSLDGSKLELHLACVKSAEIQPAPAERRAGPSVSSRTEPPTLSTGRRRQPPSRHTPGPRRVNVLMIKHEVSGQFRYARRAHSGGTCSPLHPVTP